MGAKVSTSGGYFKQEYLKYVVILKKPSSVAEEIIYKAPFMVVYLSIQN
jgi:hypothetical protein